MGEERQRFLAEATEVLVASSLDYAQILDALAQVTVPRLADWCSIVLKEGERSFRQLAVAHADPGKQPIAKYLDANYPLNPKVPYGIANVLRTGLSELYPEITKPALAAVARDEPSALILDKLGVKSAMLVPLKARGHTLGVITMFMAESQRRFSEEDLKFAEDLAHRAALVVDNARLYEELKRASEGKDEFLGLVSHELRNPITTILGGIALLRSNSATLAESDKTAMLADVEMESKRLHRLVENLLVIARVELGDEMPGEPILAQRILEKEIAWFSQRSGRRVICEIASHIPPVRVPETTLEQVLGNLLTNSHRYSPADKDVEVRAEISGEREVTISVLDRGPGIALEEVDTIFERFYRSERPRPADGLGLGLTVCKRLVEANGGRIWAVPRAGGGLQISFAIPVYGEDQ